MKIHSSHTSLLTILAIVVLSVTSQTSLRAQAVTWAATGLPPGMTISTVNSSNGVISGTPTTPGNYTAIVYPKVGTVAGDQTTVSITVLPAGVTLPTYYGYNRVSTSGSDIQALAGGAWYIFGICYGSTIMPFFTTNGTTFTQPALPSGANPFASGPPQAAISGSRCLVSGNGVMDYSDNQGAFKSLALPTVTLPAGIANADYANSGIAANGTNGFFCAVPVNSQNPTNFTYSYNLQIFSMSTNATTWTSRASFATTNQLYSPRGSVAVNGSFVVMAISSSQVPTMLLYSTTGGTSWTSNSANPGILSVAYGNGIWLGTGNNGVYSSSNGINWTQVATGYEGNIIYSPYEKLFFSPSGVSSNGVYWQNFYDFGGYGSIVSSGTGVVFLANRQLSTTYVPSFFNNTPYQASVGKAASISVTVGQ